MTLKEAYIRICNQEGIIPTTKGYRMIKDPYSYKMIKEDIGRSIAMARQMQAEKLVREKGYRKLLRYAVMNERTGMYECQDDVIASECGLTSLPANVDVVLGCYDIAMNRLTSLKNIPRHIDGDCNISYNPIVDWSELPLTVSGSFYAKGIPDLTEDFLRKHIKIGGGVVLGPMN